MRNKALKIELFKILSTYFYIIISLEYREIISENINQQIILKERDVPIITKPQFYI